VAFANGMGSACLVAAIVAFCGALISLFFLPSRARDPLSHVAEQEEAEATEIGVEVAG
jgi:hypothetical protein